jgi:tetratricopeptide (TPR) repeat protein
MTPRPNSKRNQQSDGTIRNSWFLRLTGLILVTSALACMGTDSRDETAGDAAPATSDPASAGLPPGVEAVSLLGEALEPPELPPEVAEGHRRNLAEALAELEAHPESADAWIWAGRRLAYLGRYREAIQTYTDGLSRFPDDPRFLRHRGHRHITVREFDEAIDDLERAGRMIQGTEDQVEPDGLPNARGIPTSTLHFNIWYHLGLAHYLQGDFEAALEAYQRCMDVSRNPDSVVATSHWMYMTLRRLGRDAEAEQVLEPIVEDMDVIESTAYHELLLMYKGAATPAELLGPTGESATLQSTTTAYGVGNWYLYNGDGDRAFQIFDQIHLGRSQWAAFGYIAAEAELSRRP